MPHPPIHPDAPYASSGHPGDLPAPAGADRTLQHPERHSCRLVFDQRDAGSMNTTAFQCGRVLHRIAPPREPRSECGDGVDWAAGRTGEADRRNGEVEVPLAKFGAAVLAHTSRSQLWSSHRPIATTLTA
jgi:hypothetical protein